MFMLINKQKNPSLLNASVNIGLSQFVSDLYIQIGDQYSKQIWSLLINIYSGLVGIEETGD